jgi:hypothetical protein
LDGIYPVHLRVKFGQAQERGHLREQQERYRLCGMHGSDRWLVPESEKTVRDRLPLAAAGIALRYAACDGAPPRIPSA